MAHELTAPATLNLTRRFSMQNAYCVYITFYSGNKLPPFYIGSSSVEKINNGYSGSVGSKNYSELWKSEILNNRNAFKTKIISYCNDRSNAYLREKDIHLKLSVHKNSLYVNKSVALRFKTGSYDVVYGKQQADILRAERSKSNRNREKTPAAKIWHRKQAATLKKNIQLGLVEKPGKKLLETLTCSTCGLISNIGNIKRWHNEKCNSNKSRSSLYRRKSNRLKFKN